MFKRVFWFTSGAAAGLGGSFWVMRTLRQKVNRYAPDQVADNVAASLRGARDELRAALLAGRDAMKEQESSLRAEFDTPV